MNNLAFSVGDNVQDLGVKVLTARATNVRNFKISKELDTFIETELNKLKTKKTDYQKSPILQGFRELHTKVGRSNRQYPAAPEVLARLFYDLGRFPKINALVDIYNLISLKSGLALGAHDIDKISGNITLRITNGTENFRPLGKSEIIKVPQGEYCYVDDENNIICRMEVLQVEPTKITENTNDVFFIVQGNKNTNKDYIEKYTNELSILTKQFLGSEFTCLNSL